MTKHLTRRTFTIAAGAALFAPAIGGRARAADAPLRLRVSLDTAPSHLRNVSMKDYLGKVEAASEGRIKTELFESGQLYPDLEVGKALIQGQVEMAAPGKLDHHRHRARCRSASSFRCSTASRCGLIHRVIDGKPGQFLNSQIEQKLRSHVMGPYLDLGISRTGTAPTSRSPPSPISRA